MSRARVILLVFSFFLPATYPHAHIKHSCYYHYYFFYILRVCCGVCVSVEKIGLTTLFRLSLIIIIINNLFAFFHF